MNNVTIYTLSDPITGEVRYVGKTIQKLKYRLATHICRNRNNKNHTEAWVKSLLKKDLKPVIEELCVVDESVWENEEKFYISYFKYLGFRLTNHSEGGDASNLGSRWTLTEKQKADKSSKLIKRDRSLAFYRLNGEMVWDIRNVKEASFILQLPYNYLHKCYKKKKKVKNFLYLLDKDDVFVKTLNNK